MLKESLLLQTVVSNPGYMKDNFYITIETFHIADRGQQENVHELDQKALKERQVTLSNLYFYIYSSHLFRWFPLILPMMLSPQQTIRYIFKEN